MKLEGTHQGKGGEINGREGVDILELTTKIAEQEQEILKLQQQLKQRRVNRYSPQDVKAMIDLYLHWPNYADAYSHDDFVQRCTKAARNGMRRGIPEREIAINLIITIEKEVLQCHSKFEVFHEDEDDESIDAALNLLQRCDPESEFIGQEERFQSIRKAPSEHEEYYMSRVKAGQKKHLKATEEESVRICKRQFFAGLDRKPPGIEISLAAVEDLSLVAKATRELIDMANSESNTKDRPNDTPTLEIPRLQRESEVMDGKNNECLVMSRIPLTDRPIPGNAITPTSHDLRPCPDHVLLPNVMPAKHSNKSLRQKKIPSSQPTRNWGRDEKIRPRPHTTNKPSSNTWKTNFGGHHESLIHLQPPDHGRRKPSAPNRCPLPMEPSENRILSQWEPRYVSTLSSKPGRWMEELIVNKNAHQWLAKSMAGTFDPWNQLKKLDDEQNGVLSEMGPLLN